MSSVMMLERGATTPGFGGATFNSAATPAGQPTTGNYCILPRCTIKLEKCAGGCKIVCSCEDEVACGALQNLCKMLAGGLCSCCCTWNGMTVCQCNLCCGTCSCEMTKDGCCITCTSGDKQCCEMLQACCATLKCCLESGCCCYVCFNNTPVCCGTC